VIAALLRLWRGELPLSEAIGTWGLLVAVPVNMFTSVAFLWLLTLDETRAALIIGNVTIPYNIVCAVGIWRAAKQLADPTKRMVLRALTLVACIVLSIT